MPPVYQLPVHVQNAFDVLVPAMQDFDCSGLEASSIETATPVEWDLMFEIKEAMNEDLVEAAGPGIVANVVEAYNLILRANRMAKNMIQEPAVSRESLSTPLLPPPPPTPFALFRYVCNKIEARNPLADVFDYIRQHGMDVLASMFAHDCGRAFATLCPDDDQKRIRDLTALTSLPLGNECKTAGWYVVVIRDRRNAAFMRLYVGQSTDIKRRTAEHHTKHTSDTKKLLYMYWRTEARVGEVYVLGTTETRDQQWLNIVEQYWAVALQTLPLSRLDEWLPEGTRLEEEVGTNITMPISQVSLDGVYDFGWVKLYGSTDPVKREYAEGILEKILETQEENDWERLSMSMRRVGGQEGVTWRVAGDDDATAVEVHCGRCKDLSHVWIDTRPTYRISDGRYIRRRRTLCPKCGTRTVMWPTDKTLLSITQ